MKIAIYCQHVLGVGHVFRIIEICKALAPYPVTLITGGGELDVSLPNHVSRFFLPGLMMDPDFKNIIPANPRSSVETVREERKSLLLSLFQNNSFDIFLVELYPFGRKAFRFELDPVLELLNKKSNSYCKTLCSVRDILVEKKDRESYEKRVIRTLNQFFSAVLVHSDPRLIRLEDTFFSVGKIKIPIFYTGYIAPKITEPGSLLREELGISFGEKLVVASAGSGSVGHELLEETINAFNQLNFSVKTRLILFTGPYMEKKHVNKLKSIAGNHTQVRSFTSRFISYLDAADLSVSLGGYNTIMGILRTGIPAIVFPFQQNREQKMRAKKLEKSGCLRVIDESDLKKGYLARFMEQILIRPDFTSLPIHLDGAEQTRSYLLN